MIEKPHELTNVMYLSSSQLHVDANLLNGLIAEGTGRKESSYFSAAHSQQAKAVPDQKKWQPQLVPHVPHNWHTDTVYDIDLGKAQDMGLKSYQTLSNAVVHFGDVPAECFARAVGDDQTIFYERPSQVAPHAPAIQPVVHASGDRLLDSDQHQKRLNFIGNCGTDKSMKLRQYQEKGTEVDAHDHVVGKVPRTGCKRKVLLHMWSIL